MKANWKNGIKQTKNLTKIRKPIGTNLIEPVVTENHFKVSYKE